MTAPRLSNDIHASCFNLATIERIRLQFEVEELMRAYCACIDEDRLEEWPDFFTEAAHYEITTRANADRGLPANALWCQGVGMMKDRVVSLRHANVYGTQYYRHLISNVALGSVTPMKVEVTTHYMVVRTMARDGDPLVFSVGRTQDAIVMTPTGLRFSSRKVVSDNDRIHTLLVLPI